MWIRMLPGLAVSAALAVILCLRSDVTHDENPAASVALVSDAQPENHTAPAVRGFFRPANNIPAVTSTTLAATTPFSHTPEPIPYNSSSTPSLCGRQAANADWHGYPEHKPVAEASPAGNAPSRTHSLSGFPRFASHSALANPATFMKSFPMGDPMPAGYGNATYADLPPRGMEVWGKTESFREKQTLPYTAYRLSGTAYSLGIRYDWSMNSILGVSADLLKSTVKGGQPLDKRENDISGYRIQAHYEGVLFDYWLASATGFYERHNVEGGGRIGAMSQSGIQTREWTEDKHSAEGYGLSFRLGLPVVWGNDFKLLHEIGLEYREVRSKEYAARLAGLSSFMFDEARSRSLSIPIAVTIRKEYLKNWGIVTPKVNFGYRLELDKGAAGVRTLRASSASRFDFDPVTGFRSAGVHFESEGRQSINLGLGMEVKTIWGWEMAAEYQRTAHSNYSRDVFSLELGRCF